MFPRQEVIDLPSRQINEISQKGNRKKIELVARPAEIRHSTESTLVAEWDETIYISVGCLPRPHCANFKSY